jgi:hypothetical protein
MKCLWVLFLFFLFLSVMAEALFAQEPLITAETSVDYGILHQWLHSSDPRLIAWAADFARRTHAAKIVADMPELLEDWTVPQVFGDDESQAAQRRAVTAVLDTLIQENPRVPIPASYRRIFSGAGGHPDWAASIVRIACDAAGLDLRSDGKMERTHPGADRIDDAGEGSGTEPRNLEPE